MDRLWSPWRYRYVSNPLPADDCIFCTKATQSRDEENLILYRGQHNFVLLNLFPYATGHLMVVPYQHIASLEELPDDTATELMRLTQEAIRHIRTEYKPQGLNAGLNLGECAGAGVAGHLHLHVVPRWVGDANFMTTVGETRVLPEDLGETWRRLRAAFQLGR